MFLIEILWEKYGLRKGSACVQRQIFVASAVDQN